MLRVIALLQNISDYLVQRNSLTFCNLPLGQRKPRIVGDQMTKNDITRSGREKVRTCVMLSSCWIYNQLPILYYSRKNWRSKDRHFKIIPENLCTINWMFHDTSATHFWLMLPFCTPWKHQKTGVFLVLLDLKIWVIDVKLTHWAWVSLSLTLYNIFYLDYA